MPTPDPVIVIDLENRVTFMNSAAEGFIGCSKSDAMDQPLMTICRIVNDESEKLKNPVEVAAQVVDAPGLNRAILIARDGEPWPIDDSSAPILDAAGRTTGTVLIFHDYSRHRKIDQALKFSELRYRRLFESAHDGILILDAANGKVLEVNPFMGELLGYAREHFLGKELWEIGVFKDVEASKATMATLQKTGHIRYEDHPLQHSDGRHIPVEFVSNVYREGEQDVIQCNIRDITERKHLADELTHSREEAQAASRSKSEFLANMSHEIRTPMSAIVGFADMLLQKTSEECKEIGCVQIIRRNALHLLELINDILDLSKVEAGQMEVEHTSVDLLGLLSEVIALMRPRATEMGLKFGVTFEGSIPRLIRSDAFRLRQILINLIGNALKFTESGKIGIRIIEEESAANLLVRVDVSDSGIGMTLEQVNRLFQPFTQGDSSITRKFGGTGLGLTISRKLAELLGGSITVTSQLGFGSTFTLKIDGGPFAGVERLHNLTEAMLPKKEDKSAKAEAYLCGRILLVEDGADNQRLLRMQLSSAGGSVVSALNGRIAVDLATTQPFDLILMDMQMPILDGYAATVELRRQGLKIPIIALTAHAMAEDRDKCIASGCDAYLSKPVDEATLLATVNQYLGKSVPHDSAQGGIAGLLSSLVADHHSDRVRSTLASDSRMTEIIQEFVESLPEAVGAMVHLLEQRDMFALQRIAHDLAGTGGGYGFAAITQPARRSEQSIKAGDAFGTVAVQINSLIEIIRRIEGYDESKEFVATNKWPK